MVKISFVCPIFNKEKYLSVVLNALKKQKGNFRKEYVFVNDGSQDNSLERLRSLTKNWKNTKIISQINKGPASATQRGIDSSTGDYIKLLGGDDVMSENCTNILLEVITKNKTVAVFSRYQLVKNLNKVKFDQHPPLNLRILKNPLKKTILSNYSGTSPNLYCNKTIKKSGGCNLKLFIEDFSLVLGIAKYGSFSFIDNVTSCGPSEDPNRIMMGQKTQLIHDFNAALYYFFMKNNSVPNHIKMLACKKVIGRTEKWARRLKNQSIFNKMNFLKLKLLFGNKNYQNLIKQACLFFYSDFNDEKIRYKIE
ncbi:MAG: hypothetical protein CL572_06940 [Alphaproteobacteria bacterium]|nr:hypothetical protein [Alphaproteobacteria bacterium]